MKKKYTIPSKIAPIPLARTMTNNGELRNSDTK